MDRTSVLRTHSRPVEDRARYPAYPEQQNAAASNDRVALFPRELTFLYRAAPRNAQSTHATARSGTSSCAHEAAFQRREIPPSQAAPLDHRANTVCLLRTLRDACFPSNRSVNFSTAYRLTTAGRSPLRWATPLPVAEKRWLAHKDCHRELHPRAALGL